MCATCIGWPFPQFGVPQCTHSAGPASMSSWAQNRGVIPDFRPPDVVRLAPIALYTSFHEVWTVVQHLLEIVERHEYLTVAAGRDLVA